MTTFEFVLSLFNLYGIVFLTVLASKAEYGRGFAIFGIVCFALSLTLRLTSIYVGA